MPVRPKRIPRVALLVETTRTYTRELLAGVRRYLAGKGPWSTFLELRALDSSPPAWLRRWDGDGILTRTFTQETADLIAASGLPAVELRSTHLNTSLPFVGMDNHLVGRMVAEHFFERGYRQFGAYSLHTERFFEERVRNFVSTVDALGCACSLLPETTSDSAADWEQSQARLIAWLSGLPKPVGVFAANDQLGVRLLDACQRAGIAVPEEVAVVGAENEETLCAFATPPLTSVRFDGHTVGYRAAELLDRLMRGGSARRREILLPPKGIVVRASSDELVIHDPLVANAVRLIRENVGGGLNVDDLCRRLNASRSTLDRRMKAALKRSPKEEILRIRFREVERLLLETDLTIDAIAAQTGFAHSHYLQAAFKESRGQTPGRFRRTGAGPA
ncbi:MAG: DNA-binding transcriptional regulator [Limisphaerales bacterium]